MLKPKRPMSAYMMWWSASREQINLENLGLTNTELLKKGGEIWKTLDKSVWQEKAAKVREQYEKDLEAYNAHLGCGDSSGVKKKKLSAHKGGKEEGEKVKLINKPRPPLSAYMMWLWGPREELYSKENRKLSEIDIWRKIDKSVWVQKAAIAREQYEKKLRAYNVFIQKLKNAVKTDKPGRPKSAYVIWDHASKEQIESKYPGLEGYELFKIKDRIWRTVDKSVWEEKAAKAKEEYDKDLEAYYAHLGGGDSKLGKKMDRRVILMEKKDRRENPWDYDTH